MPVDSFFYDRMISGYAVHHEIAGKEPMLEFYHRMIREGKKPSWFVLEEMVRALEARGERNLLLQIIDDVRRWVKEGGGEMMVGRRERGQGKFWDFILSTGLLRDEDVRLRDLWNQQRQAGTVLGVE